MDIAAWLRQLSDPDAATREEAVVALVEIGTAEVIDRLQALPREGATWKSVARVLGGIGSPQAIDILAAALDSPSNETCLTASLALADAGSAAAAALIRGLQHHSAPVRARCAMALGRLRSSAAVPGLLEIITDSDWTVRLESILALAALKDDRAVPALVQALKDEEEAVRQTAPVALGEIGSETAIAGLRTALIHDDETVRWIAEWQLKELASG